MLVASCSCREKLPKSDNSVELLRPDEQLGSYNYQEKFNQTA